MNRPMRNRRSCRGQNLVEFGLVLPILIITMLGIVDVGFIYFVRGSVDNATREGVRYGSVHAPSTSTSSIVAQVQQTVIGVAPSSLTINVTCCDSANNCNPAPDASCVQGNWVTVQVQYPLTTFWPVPASGTYQTSSTMRIELPDTVS